MNSRNEQLRQRILRIAEQERPALADVIARLPAIANRPVFLVAPESHVGMVHGPRVVAELHHVVAAIDDQSIHLDHIHGAPRWSSQEFLSKAGQYADAIAIDFSCSPRGRVFANDLCASAGIEQLSVAPSVDPPIPGFEQRPLFLLQPRSGLGNIYGPQIVQRSSHVIAAIDEEPSDSDTVHGVPRWSSRQFIEQAAQYSQALAIDFLTAPENRAWPASSASKQALKGSMPAGPLLIVGWSPYTSLPRYTVSGRFCAWTNFCGLRIDWTTISAFLRSTATCCSA